MEEAHIGREEGKGREFEEGSERTSAALSSRAVKPAALNVLAEVPSCANGEGTQGRAATAMSDCEFGLLVGARAVARRHFAPLRAAPRCNSHRPRARLPHS